MYEKKHVSVYYCIRYLDAGLSETLNTVMQCKRPTQVHVPGTLTDHHLKDPLHIIKPECHESGKSSGPLGAQLAKKVHDLS